MEAFLGEKIKYKDFLIELDSRLDKYFESFGANICCKRGCADCCEKGEYPVSDVELEFLTEGYKHLEPDVQSIVRQNIKNMEKGGKCPFLIEKLCSVYEYRPIVCRVHGLAYLYKGNEVKLPYCAENNKNFSKLYKNGIFEGNPIPANLDTSHVLEGIYSDIKSLYDWFNSHDV